MSCCGTRYYCTADGPVAVEPDADGWYEVPDGGTSGWYKTYEEALETCSEPVTLINEGACRGVGEPDLLIPSRLTVTFLTGSCAGTSITLDYQDPSGPWYGIEDTNNRSFTLWPCFAVNYSGGVDNPTEWGYGNFAESSFTDSPFNLTGTITDSTELGPYTPGACGSTIDIIITE